MNKNTPYTHYSTVTASGDRYSTINGAIKQDTIIIANVYVPNTEFPQFFYSMVKNSSYCVYGINPESFPSYLTETFGL